MQLPIATVVDGEPHCPDRKAWRVAGVLLLMGWVEVYDGMRERGAHHQDPTRAARLQFQAGIQESRGTRREFCRRRSGVV
jgi:hypothetical protein